MTTAICSELAAANCPCFLALLNKCTYCSLLQGKDTCNCCWDGDCAYHYFPWQEIYSPDCPDNTLLAAIQNQNIWKLIIKANDTLLSAPLGSIVSLSALENSIDMHCPQTILLSSYPESGLAYLVSSATYPFASLQNKIVTTTIKGNAFLRYERLQTLNNKQILILTEEKLMDTISPFISSLKNQSDVVVGDITTSLTLDNFNPDIVFLAGSKNTILKMMQQMPPSFNSKYVLWII